MTAHCPLCERGDLESRTIDETIRHGGVELVVPGVEISVCSSCGEEVVLPEQARRNEVLFADAKRREDGLMTSSEIVAWRKRHGLTQKDAGIVIGGGVNAFSKYERGEVLQLRAVDSFMRAIDAFPPVLAFLCLRAGIAMKPDRSGAPVTGANVIALSTTKSIRRTSVNIAANDEWQDLRQDDGSAVTFEIEYAQCGSYG
ncbi:type II toxin-antitoxin system MqsA family antitoxin [Dyella sp.]|jgi:HTH-type transcriptional regulator/antitoxin MqsA|uniref:type II toxin-antitoxin system MqsA family antitoxin n=1 Tax=Dyella sp. TaxID=1869338 RepID=UPI002D77DC8F|nr:type II toxin-antitoxin system MqsA family antitoxin [Dyella sp.]HET6433880.1 type II toxin-antitoxin system MqsA family antitoxin [Dyella sp.]